MSNEEFQAKLLKLASEINDNVQFNCQLSSIETHLSSIETAIQELTEVVKELKSND